MFFLGGSILLPTKENQIEQLQIASQQISKFNFNKKRKLLEIKDCYNSNKYFNWKIKRLNIAYQLWNY